MWTFWANIVAVIHASNIFTYDPWTYGENHGGSDSCGKRSNTFTGFLPPDWDNTPF